MKIYLSLFLVLAMTSCSNSSDDSALDAKKVVGRISDRTELLRIQALANRNDEKAMHQMVLHLQASGRWTEAKKICDRGAELKYEKMLYCSSAYKFEEGGNKNCSAVINNYVLLEEIIHDKQTLRRYQIALGVDIRNDRATCGDIWRLDNASG